MKPYIQTNLIIGSIIFLLHILANLPPGILAILLFSIPASVYLIHKTTPDLRHRYSLPWVIAAHILSYLLTANLIIGPIICIILLIISSFLHLIGIPFQTTQEYLFRDYL